MFQLRLNDDVRERLRNDVLSVTYGGAHEADELVNLFEKWLIEARKELLSPNG